MKFSDILDRLSGEVAPLQPLRDVVQGLPQLSQNFVQGLPSPSGSVVQGLPQPSGYVRGPPQPLGIQGSLHPLGNFVQGLHQPSGNVVGPPCSQEMLHRDPLSR